MKENQRSPHDEFFKFVFSIMPCVRDFLAFVPDPRLRKLDLETLEEISASFISPDIIEFECDKIFACKMLDRTQKSVEISLLLEHKSSVPSNIYDQLNLYLAQKRHKERQNGQKSVLSISIVFYHGKQNWIYKKPAAYFKNLPPDFENFVLGSEYILFDLSKFLDKKLKQLRESRLINALILMKHFNDKTYFRRDLSNTFVLGDFYKSSEEGRDFMFNLIAYFIKSNDFRSDEFVQIVNQNLPVMIKDDFKSTYDYIIEEGIEQGRVIGEENALKKFQTKAVIRDIRRNPDWSDTQIAEYNEVSLDFVQLVRAELEGFSN